MSQIPTEISTLDLFAGPGGWGPHLGIEVDDEVCATRRAAGLPTIQADVSRVNPDSLGTTPRGILASAPCPPFSAAGNGEGRKDLELVAAGCISLAAGRDSRRELGERAQDQRSLLSAEPLRWVLALRPEWTVWEQVQGAQPIWEVCAGLLAHAGYNVWTGYMDASDYGVAQSRKRSILIASRTRLAYRPEPRPPVVMRDVLDWKERDDGVWLQMGRSRGTRRTLDQPAPTLMFGKSPSGVAWYWPDGESRPIELEEAALLQGFPADYPFQGGKVRRFRQVGDAVPRQMADSILEVVT